MHTENGKLSENDLRRLEKLARIALNPEPGLIITCRVSGDELLALVQECWGYRALTTIEANSNSIENSPYSWQPKNEFAFYRYSPDGLQEWQVVQSFPCGTWHWRTIDRQTEALIFAEVATHFKAWDDAAVDCGRWWREHHS